MVIATMGDGIDTDVEADEYGAFMDVRDCPGILALDFALAGVAVYALDIRLYRNVLQRVELHA